MGPLDGLIDPYNQRGGGFFVHDPFGRGIMGGPDGRDGIGYI